jgi:hypothetical protein
MVCDRELRRFTYDAKELTATSRFQTIYQLYIHLDLATEEFVYDSSDLGGLYIAPSRVGNDPNQDVFARALDNLKLAVSAKFDEAGTQGCGYLFATIRKYEQRTHASLHTSKRHKTATARARFVADGRFILDVIPY